MKKVYLINEVVLFSPENCSLTPRKSWPSGRVTLHAPASECLHLLLTHAGQPVTQKQLFAETWEKKGVFVSTNTLYQSIASIRKGLKAAGLEDDIIRTLPKQGFQCNAIVQFGEPGEFIPAAPVSEAVVPTARPTEIATASSRSYKPDYPVIASVLMTLAMISALLFWNQNSNSLLPIQYYPAGQVERCELYSSWSGTDYSQAVFNELRSRYPINCAKKPSPTSPLIACK